MIFLLANNSTSLALWQAMKLILIFVLILVMAYYATKFVAKYQSNVLNGKNNIKIIESMSLGNNKILCIVEINNAYYALGLGKDEITLIDKLDDFTISKDVSDETTDKKSFKDVMAQFKDKK